VFKLLRALAKDTGANISFEITWDEEKEEWVVNVTGYDLESSDERFVEEQEYLKELIGDPSTTLIRFAADANELSTATFKGGSYFAANTWVFRDFPYDQKVILHPVLLNDEDSFSYKSYGKRISFRAWDAMAHELFGHALNEIRGVRWSRLENEAWSRWRANKVRNKYEKPPRD